MEITKKFVSYAYLGVGVGTSLIVGTVVSMVLLNRWPYSTTTAAVVVSVSALLSLVSFWFWLSYQRKTEHVFLMQHVRLLGGRTTVSSLSQRSQRSVQRIKRFLEMKVALGQAVVALEDDEPLYIFEGFVDYTGKELGFNL